MYQKSTIRCESPRCAESVKKHGEPYHRVVDGFNIPEDRPDMIAQCGGCGGYTDGKGNWLHRCRQCKQEVQPGELVGLFVPYACKPCLTKIREEEIKKGHVCSLCRKPYSSCCC